MKLLYVGAGTDVRRALRIAAPHTELLMVDSQPFSEFGKLQCGMPRADGAGDGYSRPAFPRHVARQLKRHRLEFRVESDVWTCTRNGVVVLTYLMNTAIPQDLPRIDLRNVDALIVMGHHPHAAILDALPVRPLRFIGGDGTSYSDDDEEDTVVRRLHRDATTRSAFSCFTYHDFSGHGSHVFLDWFEFVRHARRR